MNGMSMGARPSWFFAAHSSSDVVKAIDPSTVVVQPIGAIEHHGPHLPLSTDALIAEEVAAAVSADHPELGLLVLPTLAYALSTEHQWSPGTITLSPTTLLAVLDELADSLVRTGVTRLAFLNTHGGNTDLLKVACRELRVRHDLHTFLLHPSLPPDHGGESSHDSEHGLGIHGGFEETSIVLHLRPELVEMSVASADLPTWTHEYERVRFGGRVHFGWTSTDLTGSGVAGDPTHATADDGKALFTAAVERLTQDLDEVRRFTFPAAGRNDPHERSLV